MQNLFLKALRAIFRLIVFFIGRITITGRENIPAQGPYIIVTNHMSKADPPVIFLSFPIPPLTIRYFAAEKWENSRYGALLKSTGALFINRGEVDREALKEALDAIKEGQLFGLAPEGTRSKVGALIHAKDGAAYLATRTNVPILPVGVINTDVVGANIKKLRRTHLRCHIGKPINLPDLGRRPRSSDLAAHTHYIMVHIAALLPERYHGYYKDSPALAAMQRGEDPWTYCLQAEGVEP